MAFWPKVNAKRVRKDSQIWTREGRRGGAKESEECWGQRARSQPQLMARAAI